MVVHDERVRAGIEVRDRRARGVLERDRERVARADVTRQHRIVGARRTGRARDERERHDKDHCPHADTVRGSLGIGLSGAKDGAELLGQRVDDPQAQRGGVLVGERPLRRAERDAERE